MKSLLWSLAVAASLALRTAGSVINPTFEKFNLLEHPDPLKRDLLQDVVTWDNQSLSINGERLMVFSGEVHFFRLPVSSLYVDVLQKIKALGFNCVSFYVDWALLEGKSGEYSADGIFALEPIFEAAKQAGMYLLARPGPYINAEVSGGGFPGWLSRISGHLRTTAPDYLEATDNYVANVASTIAKAQVTNGGPVILYQPENEYSYGCCGEVVPDGEYFQYVIDQAREAGIVVPLINNDVNPAGHNAPGTGVGEVDIYGHDSYPLGFDCANPTVWPEGNLPTDWRDLHLENSPDTPYSILEFQAGAYGAWGGIDFEQCSHLVNHEFERVFYKNNFGFGISIFNLYMIFGGTNWGNLGHPGGYTSYDYGAAITEDRGVFREKYSELKLIGNFIKTSPTYLDTVPGSLTNSKFTNTTDLTVTPLIGRLSNSSFFVLRHSKYESVESTNYKLYLPTSVGNLTVPQLEGTLTLQGRDSKIHVTDYDVAGTNILYSTAEIFTWKQFHDRKVLVVYGGLTERHELAVSGASEGSLTEGPEVLMETGGDYLVLNWAVSSERSIVRVDGLDIFIIDRNSAHNYWVPELPGEGTHPSFPSLQNTESSIIVKAGYLVRTAYLRDDELHLTADFNTTTAIEVVGAPESSKTLHINGKVVEHHVGSNGIWTTEVEYSEPDIQLPDLKELDWKYVDALPEIQDEYDDSLWTAANNTESNNPRELTTPTSLYSGDYGYHIGSLLYRGHFVASGLEESFSVATQGGTAFGSSVWLNGTFLGSWEGSSATGGTNSTYPLPELVKGGNYVFTVLIDVTGVEPNWTPGEDAQKTPRGILDFDLIGNDNEQITWKLTGNMGGEDYVDRVRGPLNEGALYVERQGWHQPQPPSELWESINPITDGVPSAGVGFFSTHFDLEIPGGWDVPMSFTVTNNTESAFPYRVQLYVNGYQFGKYVSSVGPQTRFPVPQGILDYHGKNWIGITLWSLEDEGAVVENLELESGHPVMTALKDIKLVGMPPYRKRKGAY